MANSPTISADGTSRISGTKEQDEGVQVAMAAVDLFQTAIRSTDDEEQGATSGRPGLGRGQGRGGRAACSVRNRPSAGKMFGQARFVRGLDQGRRVGVLGGLIREARF